MFWISHRKRFTTKSELLGIFLVSFLINFPLSLNFRFFYADDWGWLGTASQYPVTFYTRIIPEWIYNDRPIGTIFIDAEFSTFGLNYSGYRLTHVLLHCINAALVYLLTSKFTNKLTATLAAIYFAGFYPANAAAFWVAAIFDLLGLTLSLVSLLFVMRKYESPKFQTGLWLGTLSLFLAIRTKEFNILVPLLLVLFLKCFFGYTLKQIIRRYWLFFLPSLILGAVYIRLYFASRELIASTQDVYGFSPSSVPKNLIFYLKSVFLYEYFAIFATIGLVIFTVSSAYFIARFPKDGGFPILFGIAGFIIYLGPVLLLQGQKSNLYLYSPHAFLGISLASLITKLSPRVMKLFLIIVVLASSQILLAQKGGVEFSANKSVYSKAVWENSVTWIKTLRKGENVYISGLETYFNPFSYGPGASIKILSGDRTSNIFLEIPVEKLEDEFCDAKEPKRFIAYRGVKPSDISREVLSECIP